MTYPKRLRVVRGCDVLPPDQETIHRSGFKHGWLLAEPEPDEYETQLVAQEQASMSGWWGPLSPARKAAVIKEAIEKAELHFFFNDEGPQRPPDVVYVSIPTDEEHFSADANDAERIAFVRNIKVRFGESYELTQGEVAKLIGRDQSRVSNPSDDLRPFLKTNGLTGKQVRYSLKWIRKYIASRKKW